LFEHSAKATAEALEKSLPTVRAVQNPSAFRSFATVAEMWYAQAKQEDGADD
jgi:hypothetical protein